MIREQGKWVALLSIVLVMGLAGLVVPVTPSMADDGAAGAGGAPSISTQKDRNSYSLGVETYNNYKRLGMDIDPDLVVRGFKDAAAGKLLMSENDIASTMINFRGEVIVKQRSDKIGAGQKNRQEGDAFLAANKGKEGVVTLPSGLQYKVLKAATGRKPTDMDTVECNWRGTLIDGTEFEDTYKSGQPVKFRVSDFHVIQGMRDVVKLMPVGSKWQVVIPSRLAYMTYGRGPMIGPNAILIYEVELLDIK
jgi:FKBP-type peptidyl-prolyl cis-trans isomerase